MTLIYDAIFSPNLVRYGENILKNIIIIIIIIIKEYGISLNENHSNLWLNKFAARALTYKIMP